jgi:hypothetical protein
MHIADAPDWVLIRAINELSKDKSGAGTTADQDRGD